MNAATMAHALEDVVDPELGIDIVSLGLLYGLDADERALHVRMTMTTPGCPMATAIAQMTATRLRAIAEDREVEIEVVEDPPWDVAMLDGAARKRLGIS
ncbi:MAG: metal-sulfur cluster assembly factor [Dehalococcoidia bacterium]|jgi:metal-sulfur cluster biosynthetic enzyme